MNNNEKEFHKKIKKQKVLILALSLCLSMAILMYLTKSDTDSLSKKFPLLDPLRQFVPAENYITNIQSLREYLHGLEEKYPESITIYYENINSGSNISVNKDLRLFPASLSKLVQAILIVNKVEKGILSFDQELKALPEYISAGSGTLYQRLGDAPLTVELLLKELLVNSDNTAQNIFRHQLEFSDYVEFQNNTGLQDLYNEKGFISAKEYTRIMRVLYTSNFLKPENSEKILDHMANSSFKDFLSQGIPKDVVFAHKYGENKDYNIFADSGIVYVPGKPYMISVIIKGKDSSLETRAWAANLMKEISERAYEVNK